MKYDPQYPPPPKPAPPPLADTGECKLTNGVSMNQDVMDSLTLDKQILQMKHVVPKDLWEDTETAMASMSLVKRDGFIKLLMTGMKIDVSDAIINVCSDEEVACVVLVASGLYMRYGVRSD